MRVIDLGFLVLWVAFWLFWLAAAVAARRPRSSPARHPGVGIRAGVLVVVLVLRFTVLAGNAGVGDQPILQAIGSCLFVVGLALALWARVHLGRSWGLPMSETSGSELITTGPYRCIRHPIYSGLILAMIGTAVAVGVHWLIVAAVLGVYFIYSATVEERTMTRLFPATYPAYKRATKMLVPFFL